MVLTAIFAGAESVFAETEENTIEPVNMNSATSASYYTISGYSGSNIMYTEVNMPKAALSNLIFALMQIQL